MKYSEGSWMPMVEIVKVLGRAGLDMKLFAIFVIK